MSYKPLSTLFVVLKYLKKRKIADFVPIFQGEDGMCAQTFCTQMIEGDPWNKINITKIIIINS